MLLLKDNLVCNNESARKSMDRIINAKSIYIHKKFWVNKEDKKSCNTNYGDDNKKNNEIKRHLSKMQKLHCFDILQKISSSSK